MPSQAHLLAGLVGVLCTAHRAQAVDGQFCLYSDAACTTSTGCSPASFGECGELPQLIPGITAFYKSEVQQPDGSVPSNIFLEPGCGGVALLPEAMRIPEGSCYKPDSPLLASFGLELFIKLSRDDGAAPAAAAAAAAPPPPVGPSPAPAPAIAPAPAPAPTPVAQPAPTAPAAAPVPPPEATPPAAAAVPPPPPPAPAAPPLEVAAPPAPSPTVAPTRVPAPVPSPPPKPVPSPSPPAVEADVGSAPAATPKPSAKASVSPTFAASKTASSPAPSKPASSTAKATSKPPASSKAQPTQSADEPVPVPSESEAAALPEPAERDLTPNKEKRGPRGRAILTKWGLSSSSAITPTVIAGAVGGAVLLAVLIVATAFFVWRKNPDGARKSGLPAHSTVNVGKETESGLRAPDSAVTVAK